MAANIFVQTAQSVEFAEHAITDFLANEVAATPFTNAEEGFYLYCHCAPEDAPTRRVLVVTDRYSEIVRVCIEAAYELFAGDTHYHVRRIGTVTREQVETQIEPLVRQAFSELVAWKPTHENIWDYVF